MEENKKVYSITGTVTIGTDEYRDLLTDKFEAIKDKEDYYHKWAELYRERDTITTENKKLKEELEQLKRYIKENNEQDKLELWIVRTSRDSRED